MGVLLGIYVGGQGRRLLHCLNARCPVIGHGAGLESRGVRIRTVAFRKGKSPVLRGFQPWIPATTTFFSNIGTPPAIPQARPSFGNLGTGRPGIPSLTPGLITLTATSPPVLGTLVQAGRGFPLLHRAHHAHSDEPNPFREPWYRQAGDSLFYTGLITLTATSPTRFGNLGTGRPGIPSFIPPADGSAASSARRPWSRPTRRAAVAPPPGSAATPHPPP